MIDSSLLIAITLLSASQPAKVTARTPQIITIISGLHARNWTKITPENVRDVTASLVFSAESVDYPANYTGPRSCKPPIYMNASEGPLLLTLEFEPLGEDLNCRLALSNIAVNGNMGRNAAETLFGMLVGTLRPGGEPSGDGTTMRYLWRSRDSHTKYDLSLMISAPTDDAGPSTLATFKALLTHETTEPSVVDYLPFERGVTFDCGTNSNPGKASPSSRKH
jgi:hypothetical protein